MQVCIRFAIRGKPFVPSNLETFHSCVLHVLIDILVVILSNRIELNIHLNIFYDKLYNIIYKMFKLYY